MKYDHDEMLPLRRAGFVVLATGRIGGVMALNGDSGASEKVVSVTCCLM